MYLSTYDTTTNDRRSKKNMKHLQIQMLFSHLAKKRFGKCQKKLVLHKKIHGKTFEFLPSYSILYKNSLENSIGNSIGNSMGNSTDLCMEKY